MKNILISAYACEPNKGSEPEVGWQWGINLAKYNKVWIITRTNNKQNIESFFQENICEWRDNLKFIYVDLPNWKKIWKKGNRGIHLYYSLWQKEAFKYAKKLHKINKFDLVHSITFVSYTQICYWDKLKIPFFWTVAGGENISKEIRYPLKLNEKSYEILRSINQLRVHFSLRTKKMLNASKIIFAATSETLNKIPKRYHDKVIVFPAIGISNINKCKLYDKTKTKIKILVSGKFIYLKGIDIAIKTCIKIGEKYDNVQFDILGNGKYGDKYKKMCGKLLNKKIFFIDKIPHENIYEFYKEHDILLNTALRDSGCLVVLEAMSVGLPIVCLNSGGVKEMTTEKNSFKIEPCSYDILIEKLSEALEKLINNTALIEEMGKESYKIVMEKYTYEKKAEFLNFKYEEILEKNDK